MSSKNGPLCFGTHFSHEVTVVLQGSREKARQVQDVGKRPEQVRLSLFWCGPLHEIDCVAETARGCPRETHLHEETVDVALEEVAWLNHGEMGAMCR